MRVWGLPDDSALAYVGAGVPAASAGCTDGGVNGYPPCDIGCNGGAGVVAGGALYIWDRSSRSRILGARNVPMPVAAKCSLACSIEKTAMAPLDIETVAVRVSVMYSKEPSAI